MESDPAKYFCFKILRRKIDKFLHKTANLRFNLFWHILKIVFVQSIAKPLLWSIFHDSHDGILKSKHRRFVFVVGLHLVGNGQ